MLHTCHVFIHLSYGDVLILSVFSPAGLFPPTTSFPVSQVCPSDGEFAPYLVHVHVHKAKKIEFLLPFIFLVMIHHMVMKTMMIRLRKL